MSWYVLYTKAKAEKKAADFFDKMEIQNYCPTILVERQWSDRRKKVKVPLFRSYIFVNLEEKERNQVFGNPHIVSYMNWLGKPAVVKDEEIQVIKEWLDNDHIGNIEVKGYSPGDQIKITGGALKNKEAIIQEIGKKRMRLILPALGFTVNVEIKDVV